jgi:anti-sigma regulatory factor (Ser/Thr protein kinase)
MYELMTLALNEDGESLWASVRFDFSRLVFIDPTGVVVLSNLVDYLRRKGTKVRFKVSKPYNQGTVYLDDFGFFRHHAGKALREEAALRNTTVPLARIRHEQIFGYLSNSLIPWIAARVGLVPESISAVSTCFEEIFHNIEDHSEVQIGHAFAQFFPRSDVINVVISDFGVGIPHVVRRIRKGLSDPDAIAEACKEGFSTKTNVRNRGAGLPTLIRYVTNRNQGTVIIVSGKGELAATYSEAGPKIRARFSRGHYPGTLVKVVLRTDTFEAMEEDVEPEVFQW